MSVFSGNHKTKSLAVAGIDYKRACIAEREKLVCTVMNLSKQPAAFGGITAYYVVTCHRVELLAYAGKEDDGAIGKLFREVFGDRSFYYEDRSAVVHLLRVAAGLESAVPFEPQISDQIRNAVPLVAGGFGSKIVKTLLEISCQIASHMRQVVGASYRSLGTVAGEYTVENIGRGNVLIIGGGAMASDAASILAKNLEIKTTMITKSALVDEAVLKALIIRPEQVESLPPECFDAVLIASRRKVDQGILSWIKAGGNPDMVIDISFPRAIPPEKVRDFTYRYLDVDELGLYAENKFRVGDEARRLAEAVIAGAADYVEELILAKERAESLVTRLRHIASDIVEDEAREALAYLHGRTTGFGEVLRKALESTVNKLLHHLTHHVRSISKDETLEKLERVFYAEQN
ncbi:MAG: hypothetical protein QXJ73_07995 [Candidatus Caldarchaeum sp.]